MAFVSIREHAKHCDFFVGMNRNKKFALLAYLGSMSKQAPFKFCKQIEQR